MFIPFQGCPHQCVFCDQEKITGHGSAPDRDEISATVQTYLGTWKGTGTKEVAFYGGTFTALPVDRMLYYLRSVTPFVTECRIDSVRVSTRPDAVSSSTTELLYANHVRTVELGAQSMDDEVLRLSGRGHTAGDTVRAVGLLKDRGLRVGLQLMPGLPGDTEKTVMDSAERAISLGVDFVRIYPALVVSGTPLEWMYRRGEYAPWGLTEMVGLSAGLLRLFEAAGVPVIRLGLRHSEEFSRSVVAGPYHPSFGGLVHEACQTS